MELAVHWSGYMDGAVESGEGAAHEVLQALDAEDERERLKGAFQYEEGRGAGWDIGLPLTVSTLE